MGKSCNRRMGLAEDQCLLSLTLAGVTVGEVHCCNRLPSRGNGPLCSCNLRPGHRHYTHCQTQHEYPAGCHGNLTLCHKEEGGKQQLESQTGDETCVKFGAVQ